MNVWKRNAVVAAVVLFVCGAVYLNWSYQKGKTEEAGKTLGEAELVSMQSADPLLKTSPAPSTDPSASPAPSSSGKTTGYFDTARLNRQQARDSALSILQQSAESDTADEAMKEQMTAAIETMASTTVMMPETPMAMPLMAPSTSPSSSAREVPTAWLQEPMATP